MRRIGWMRASRAPTAILVLTLAAAALAAVSATTAWAADPSPSAAPPFIDPLDPRAGEGASQVGAPFLAAVVVIVIGVLAALATAAFVRLTDGRRRR